MMEKVAMALAEKCKIINFYDLGDERGKLVVIEGNQHIPFEIKRVFENNQIAG